MKKIDIGIVDGLLYCDYKYLINAFLEELHLSYIVSDKTNKKTLEDGKSLLVDESCLSLKIYFGHIQELIHKCDHVLVIRCPSMRKKQMMCTNFYALYDLANNLFPNKILALNIDVKNDITLEKAFVKLGKSLGYSKRKSKRAFTIASEYYHKKRKKENDKQLIKLQDQKKKILLVGHSYNLLDEYICGDIKNILRENGIEILLSNYFFNPHDQKYDSISKNIYWSKNIDILNAIVEYQDAIDGMIIISTFPCGPDSLVNEMIIRNVNLPILNLVIDETNDNGGITTRVESFIDIIKMKENIHD